MVDLLYLAVVFFAIALILGVLGWRGAGISMDIAKWLVIAFIILAILSLVFGGSINLATLLLVSLDSLVHRIYACPEGYGLTSSPPGKENFISPSSFCIIFTAIDSHSPASI